MGPRANTLGLIFKDDYILLEEQEGKHSKGTGVFYRPIGGTIELGEKSQEALKREFMEELGVEIIVKRYVTCLENIYKIDENIGHELTQIYVVDFKNEDLYERETFTITEGPYISRAKWMLKKEILSDYYVLYPNGLKELFLNGKIDV
ncbi:NUDIX hydrolase [Cytobacillus sp. FJAT-54145]|uniref:NUDIX hydrolase n=1 Tax=Cytobacillus spartinae TaxID=3299023 RepID=A0ABW6KFB2_9BACI